MTKTFDALAISGGHKARLFGTTETGETNTTPSGLTARWVTGPRPVSPPRVRLPPRPRPRLQSHTLGQLFLNPHIAWYRESNPVMSL